VHFSHSFRPRESMILKKRKLQQQKQEEKISGCYQSWVTIWADRQKWVQ